MKAEQINVGEVSPDLGRQFIFEDEAEDEVEVLFDGWDGRFHKDGEEADGEFTRVPLLRAVRLIVLQISLSKVYG